MRMASTRIATPDAEQLEPDAADLLARLPHGPHGPLNLMAVLIHNPALLRSWGRFTGSLFAGGLSARQREILILRTAWNARSSYEWGNHAGLGREAGLTDAEIERLAGGPTGEWAAPDLLFVTAADELHTARALTPQTLDALVAGHGVAHAIEAIFTVGAYQLVAALVGSLGVVDDPGGAELGSAGSG
jgi:alkylhydroperoxidase family enzyme